MRATRGIVLLSLVFALNFESDAQSLGPTASSSAVLAASTPVDDILNAPVLLSLADVNRALAARGMAHARVMQLAFMVTRDYPPGQPTLYVATALCI